MATLLLCLVYLPCIKNRSYSITFKMQGLKFSVFFLKQNLNQRTQTFHAHFQAIHQFLHGVLERASRVISSEGLIHRSYDSTYRASLLARIMVRIYPNHHKILELQRIIKMSNASSG